MYINRIQDLLRKEARPIAVETLTMSHINYGITEWRPRILRNWSVPKKLQNFAVKVAIGGASKFDHATPIFNKLQWLPIRQKVIYEQCLTSFKIMSNHLPSWLFCFPHVRNVNCTNTRQQIRLHIPRTKTDTGSRSITVRGPKLWNNLHSTIKECKGGLTLGKISPTCCWFLLVVFPTERRSSHTRLWLLVV